VARYSDAQRITLGTLYIVGGLVGGTVCLVVPVVHLFTTWGLPLVGILLGWRQFKRRVVIYQPAGVCPSCEQRLDLVGGSFDDPSWQICPHCKSVLRVEPETSSSAVAVEAAESI
jgi:hypothetical protein